MRKALLGLFLALPLVGQAADWTRWRGPAQAGSSAETGLVQTFSPDGDHLLWTHDVAGRGTPVVHGDRVYVFGYRGTGEDLREVLVALDLATGAVRWERSWRDFLSDIIYDRYSIGAPAVDPATGNVYVQSSAGVLMAFSPEGAPLWEVSMMEAYGRLTFPNGRTGAPVVDGDLVIVHFITSFWGREGPARDRFHAFDKTTGQLVWSSTPGMGPKDSSFSTPVLETRDGRRILYAGTGCGHVVAVDARTGDPIWRFPMSVGGVNVSVVLDGDLLVAAHDVENLDSTDIGRMVGLDVTAATVPQADGSTPVLQGERWRLPVSGFSSSPVVGDGLVYQVTPTGELVAVELASGRRLWSTSLGPDQLHASPLLADGRVWVPLRDGSLHVVRAGREGGQVLHRVQLAGSALGAPALADGRILVLTTERLYAFGEARPITPVPVSPPPAAATGPAVTAQVLPADLRLRPGSSVPLTARLLDAQGALVGTAPATAGEVFVPPTAKVKAQMDARFEGGALVADASAAQSAGAWKITAGGLVGETKGRVVAGLPYPESFEAFALDASDAQGAFAFPPLSWIGARFKWQVREVDGSKVLAKTLDNLLFQRSTVFLGDPDERSYRVEVSIKSDGDRRNVGTAGVVNQRYLVALKGNQRVLEVSSNQERLKHSVPFTLAPGTWYRLVTEVRVGADGAATVRAKAWPRDEPEPAAWTLEVVHPDGHTHGAPGLFGFSPGNRHAVYLDDVLVAPLEESP